MDFITNMGEEFLRESQNNKFCFTIPNELFEM